MTAPNIAATAASLRNCSLSSRERSPPSPSPSSPPRLLDPTDENVGVTVELNSEIALPYHWEQCLDIRTGEVYYLNWKDGIRTTEDPRTSTAYPASYYSSEDDDSSDEESSSGGGDDDDDDTTTGYSGVSSDGGGGDQFLVAAGCKACFMYFMVPKCVEACPKCGGGGLLQLGRNGCASDLGPGFGSSR